MRNRIVLRNSFWYGIETGVNLVFTLLTSIAIARSIGPKELGYFLFVWWVVGITSNLGGMGIATSTRKYMSEYFGRQDLGSARSIFFMTLKLQAKIALLVTAGSLLIAVFFAAPGYRFVSVLMALSMLPAMLNGVVAQALGALEDLAANVPASLLATAIFVSAVAASIYFRFGLLGIAAGLLLMRTGEFCLRSYIIARRMSGFPVAEMPTGQTKRILTFSGESLVLLVMTLVVWDRSELLFLKWFVADPRQLAYYSVAFNVTERLLVLPQMLGAGVGTTLMVQFGRDASELKRIVWLSVRYIALIAIPLHLGLAALARPVLCLTYGALYSPAVAALTASTVLGFPKAFNIPLFNIFQSYDRQRSLIKWGLAAGTVNIALDVLLIPTFGALGAAFANGATQVISSLALWTVACRVFGLKIPLPFIAKNCVASAIMGLSVYRLTRRLDCPLALVAGIPGAIVIYGGCIRSLWLLNEDDFSRLSQLRNYLPSKLRWIYDTGLSAVTQPSCRSMRCV